MELIRKAINVWLPFKCDICGGYADASGKIDRIEEIYRKIYGDKADFRVCSKCMSGLIPLESDKRWFTCLSNPVGSEDNADLTLFMPFNYTGVVDKAVPAIKFGGKYEIARLLGILLGLIIREEGIINDLIVPVPLSDSRYKERGFNQAEEIAYPVSKLINKSLAPDVVRRTRNTDRQSSLTDSNDRMINISGAFAFNDDWDIAGTRILLIDDVSTTGHTLRECALTLLENGAESVLCCAFAGNRQLKNAEPF